MTESHDQAIERRAHPENFEPNREEAVENLQAILAHIGKTQEYIRGEIEKLTGESLGVEGELPTFTRKDVPDN